MAEKQGIAPSAGRTSDDSGPTGSTADSASATPPQILARGRQSEEPRGRWETRCLYIWSIGALRALICDRPDGHRGLHRGRIIDHNQLRFLAYGAHE